MEEEIGQGLLALWILTVATARPVLAWRARRRVSRARRDGVPGHAIFAFARDFGWLTVLAIAISMLAMLVVVGRAMSVPGVVAWIGVLLTVWWFYRCYFAASSWLLGEVHGPGWDNVYHRHLAGLLYGPLLSAPLGAALVALLAYAVAAGLGRELPDALASLCIYPGLVVSHVVGRRQARRMLCDPRPLPAPLAERVEQALGEGTGAGMRVLPTRGAAFFNAIATPGMHPTVWLAEPLLEELSLDEAAAVLVHESSHVERRDDLRRMGTAVALLAAIHAAVLAVAMMDVALVSVVFVVAYWLAVGALGRPHELIADRRAGEAGLADAMGRALVKLHRLNNTPRNVDQQTMPSHPTLVDRLRALDVEVPEPTAAEAPLEKPRSILTTPWPMLIGMALVMAILLWRAWARG